MTATTNESPGTSWPTVSIVMPVFNEADFIRRSLVSLSAQSYPHSRMEIVVADGRSTDATRKGVEEFARDSPVSVALIDNPERIAPTGLNRAIAASKGEIIIRVDGHCEVDSDYVRNCVRHLTNGDADCVGGPIETVGDTTKARAIAAAMSSRFGVGGSAFRTVQDRAMYVDTVAFPGYMRETLRRIGPFNEEFVRNQDDEYNYRLRKLGGRVLLSPDIRSRYFSRSTFKSLSKQYYQYGYWKVRVLQLHPAQMSWRQFVPGGFVLSVAVLVLLAPLWGIARMGLGAVLVLYTSAAIWAAMGLAASLGVKGSLLGLVSCFLIHVSYGSGFLVGLASFSGRWRTRDTAGQSVDERRAHKIPTEKPVE